MNIRFPLACLFILPATFCQAALEVIADHGGKPAAPYYEILEGQAPEPPAQITLPTQVTTADMLPIQSQRLTPGIVEPRAIRLLGLATPLFLVGDDPASLQWLAQRQPVLMRLGAIGWAVNVADATGLQRLREAAGGLAVLPIHGDDLAGRIPLQHYPVLITPTSIEQ